MSRLIAFLRRHVEVSAIVPALLVLLAAASLAGCPTLNRQL